MLNTWFVLYLIQSAAYWFQREQILKAQELFHSANKVTRPEKSLILGFIAGSRGMKFYHFTWILTHFRATLYRPINAKIIFYYLLFRFYLWLLFFSSAENPCPQLGDVITIKLNEYQEMVTMGQNSIPVPKIVETHFQMNYVNGEWNLINRYRDIDMSWYCVVIFLLFNMLTV